MSARIDCFVSVVAPVYEGGAFIQDFVAEVLEVLRGNFTNYELVLVDDGSRDDTPEKVEELISRYACVRYIRLSRHFGTEIALVSGLDTVIGDFTVVMLPESDPPALIPAMVEKARGGAGVVFGVRQGRTGEPWWLRLGAWLFYRLAGPSIFHGQLTANSTQFRVLSRQAVNALTRIKEKKYRYLRLLTSSVGYSSESFVYSPVPRGKARSRGFQEAVALAVGMIISYSTHPLRWVSWLGLVASGVNLLYMGYVLSIFLLRSRVAEGWTTLSLQVSGMFFLLFLCLSVLAEYMGYLLAETRERPLYHVLEERNSNVLLADEQRTNIQRDSQPAALQEVSHG